VKLYKTRTGIIIENEEGLFEADIHDWDSFINDDILLKKITALLASGNAIKTESIIESEILVPVGKQELWACGVTYLRSKVGRQEESKASDGADF
jgi:2-dehydro-3-deoxy-D-arabinonate dehydratase